MQRAAANSRRLTIPVVRARLRAALGNPLLRVLLAIPVLAVLLHGLDLGHLASLVSRVSPVNLLLAGVLAAVGTGLMTAGWRSLLTAQGLDAPFGVMLRVYLVGLFFGAFTPGGLGGDLVRTYQLPGSSAQTAETAACNLAFRIIGVIALLLLAAIPLTMGLSLAGTSLAAVLLVALLVMLAVGALLEAPSLRLAARLPSSRLAVWLERLLAAVFLLKRRPAVLARAAAIVIVAQLFLSLTAYPLARGLNLDVKLVWLLAAIPLVRLAAFLPITPNGVGVYEGAAVLLFRRMGIDPETALALAVLDHLLISTVPLVGGIVYLTDNALRLRRLGAMSRPFDESGRDVGGR